MSKLSVEQIRKLAKEIISKNPKGIHYGQLFNEILRPNSETPRNTINGSIWNLHTLYPKEILKPSRGLFMPAATPSGSGTPAVTSRMKEEDFYEPFAEYLQGDLDEVIDVTVLGGKALKYKWGTPDVIGVYKPLASNLIQFPKEIVSGEVKLDTQDGPVVAFGQAIAYRLFSAKTYVAMPTSMAQEDQGRLYNRA